MNRNVLRHILGTLALVGAAVVGVTAAQAPAGQAVVADSQWGSTPAPGAGEDDSQWG
ncbi:hypothetical protein ABT116_22900 [Streptomyces sp. NPDC002130]|uniref:hypothetical protein n=1 Tax=Streptomyces sp. NPDC002130 TaxID=3155568 RepID=UPI003323167E